MRKYWLTVTGACFAALFAFLFVVGCDLDGSSVGGPTAADDPSPSAGELHNRVLEKIHAVCDEPSLSKTEKLTRTTAAVGAFALEHGMEPPTADDVNLYIERGRKIALQALEDPSILAATAFTGEDLLWWERFTEEACSPDARAVYEEHCALYGAPRKGSVLDYAADIWVHSAEYWIARHADEWVSGGMTKLQDEQSRLLRFVVMVAVDGIAGGISGASAGPVVGGIIGGLASNGADDILFGDDDEV
ncbi:MAG: hypothetical protein JW958_09930 [Candidatus Eisenbacteria bacterium]|nr:hypothetical protein [Candidatus Eisenbacteria bacterium]